MTKNFSAGGLMDGDTTAVLSNDGGNSCWLSASALLAVLVLGCVDTSERPYSQQGFTLEEHGLSCRARVSGDKLTVTLRNNTAKEARLFAWNTPWDTYGDALSVTNSKTGETVAFDGPIFNRVRDDTSDIVVPPRGQISTEYPVTEWYALPQGESATVLLKNPGFEVNIEGETLYLEHACGGGTLTNPTAGIGRLRQSLQPYPTCSNTQKERINSVITGARLAAELAQSNWTSGHDFIRNRWFGSLSWNPEDAFDDMQDSSEYVRCGSQGQPCEGNLGVVFDYFLDEKLYLCDPVWDLPYATLGGAGDREVSQVGVLVHELAHLVDQPQGEIVDWNHPSCTTEVECPLWDVGCSEQNNCYGYQDSLGLAVACPSCARRNADNYMFLAMESYMRGSLTAAFF